MVAQDARYFHCRACVEDRNRCQWNDWARVYAAATPSGLDVLAGAGSGFDSLAVDRQRLERNAVTRLTGSGYYLAGIRASGSALVQPAAMTRGPAASLPENVDLCEDSSVHGVDTRGGCRLICPDGVIAAETVILCTRAAPRRSRPAPPKTAPYHVSSR